MPLERLHHGGPSDNCQSNKQNSTDHHVFNPPKKCIEDCAATVVNGYRISGSNLIILGRCDIFAGGVYARVWPLPQNCLGNAPISGAEPNADGNSRPANRPACPFLQLG